MFNFYHQVALIHQHQMTMKKSTRSRGRKRQAKLYPWSVRNWVQLVIFLITTLIGLQFYLFVRQLENTSAVTIARPPGVEGFLPIGSLMGWKYFIATGIWDPIHPAGMVIIAFAIGLSWLLRKSFCGWFCPVGTVSEWLWRLGQYSFGKNFQLPKWLDLPLRSLKYLLLAFFMWAILGMSATALSVFLAKPYWVVSDIKMLHFFTRMSITTATVLMILVVASLLIRNFWCRYLCPYGALVGIFALISPTKIRRNTETCVDCTLCAQVCPAYLPVDKKNMIISAECTGCISCVEVCPVKETLEFKTVKVAAGFWTGKRLAFTIAGSFLLVVIIARLSGIWESSVTIEQIRAILPDIDFLAH